VAMGVSQKKLLLVAYFLFDVPESTCQTNKFKTGIQLHYYLAENEKEILKVTSHKIDRIFLLLNQKNISIEISKNFEIF